jgi:hypothetical protein
VPQRAPVSVQLIAKVYEVDPPIGPCCGLGMNLIAVITDPLRNARSCAILSRSAGASLGSTAAL